MDIKQWAYQSGIIDNQGFLTYNGLDLFRDLCPNGDLYDLQETMEGLAICR